MVVFGGLQLLVVALQQDIAVERHAGVVPHLHEVEGVRVAAVLSQCARGGGVALLGHLEAQARNGEGVGDVVQVGRLLVVQVTLKLFGHEAEHRHHREHMHLT